MDNKRGAGWSVCTNPKSIDGKMNEPSEFFALDVASNRVTVVLTIGSNVNSSKQTDIVRTARDTWINYIKQHHAALEDTIEVTETCIDAIRAAKKSMIKSKLESSDSTNTITLLGGVCCRLPNLEHQKGSNWVFICVNIGNSKAFCWNHTRKILTEITPSNTTNDTNHLDSYKEDIPDSQSSLKVYSIVCDDEANDVILVLSPCVYLNFDAQYLGKRPKDFGILNHKKWDKLEQERSKLRLDALTAVLTNVDENTVEAYVNALQTSVLQTTKKKRDFLQNSTSISEDMKLPGKLGVSTCVAFHVGRRRNLPISSLQNDDSITSKLSPRSITSSFPTMRKEVNQNLRGRTTTTVPMTQKNRQQAISLAHNPHSHSNSKRLSEKHTKTITIDAHTNTSDISKRQ